MIGAERPRERLVGFDASSRKVLLLHAGELAELRPLVERLGAQVVESAGGERTSDWDVLVTTPRHLDRIPASSRPRAVRIAVLERDARTLRALCKRAGVDWVVRRPVHPAALRLLVLHALYRGPERRVRRVPVGTRVRFRSGIRTRTAVLADLSARGGRLLGCGVLPRGRRVTVWLPDPGSGGRAFPVNGRVVRAVADEAGQSGFAVEVDAPTGRTAARLRDAVAAHSAGPAPFAEGVLAPSSPRAPARPTRAPVEAAEPELASGVDPEDAADEAGAPFEESSAVEPTSESGSDRRRAPRRWLNEQRVVALGDEAARVLIGWDLSQGGMRVAANPALRLGQRYQVALHGGGVGGLPLVVHAEVLRDDGELGLVLAFRELEEATKQQLAAMLDSLPLVEACREAAEGLVVSEIVEAEAS
jgi:hypothetical protein